MSGPLNQVSASFSSQQSQVAEFLKKRLVSFREACNNPQNMTLSASEVENAAIEVWSIFSSALLASIDTIQDLILDTAKSWCRVSSSSVVLRTFVLLIQDIDTISQHVIPNKMVRFIYCIFDELFSRSTDEEEQVVYVIKSVFSRFVSNIRPINVSITIPAIRHLVRFSSIPKLRSIFSNVFDIKDFFCVDHLGKGQFADVLKGYNKQSGDVVAIKKMKFSTASKGLQAALLREASVMAKMANVSIVRLYDSFQEDTFLYLVMEFSPLGDLEGLIDFRKSKFDHAEIAHFIRELSNGLRFLRTQSIVHRDLKPANILLFDKNHIPGLAAPSEISYGASKYKQYPIKLTDMVLKLTDFTMARPLDDGELAKTVCGSPLYMAPEVLNRKQYTDKADLWSVGVILFRLVFGTMPFNGLNEMDLRDNLNHKPVPIPENDPRLTPVLTDLLVGLLQKDPSLRIDWDEFFNHPFLRPPRLASTFLTDASTASGVSAPATILSDGTELLSISSRDTAELQRQIREYEQRLQHAQQQVQRLLGDLEQSKLREMLQEQAIKTQNAAVTAPKQDQSMQSSNVTTTTNITPNSNISTVSSIDGNSNYGNNPPASTSRAPSVVSPAGNLPMHTANGIINFEAALYTKSNAPVNIVTHQHTTSAASSTYSLAGETPTSQHSNGSYNPSSSSMIDSKQIVQHAIETVGEKLLKLSMIEPNNGTMQDSLSPKRAVDVLGQHLGQSNVSLILSQIHPDRAIAIDFVQQLLAEVLVADERPPLVPPNSNTSSTYSISSSSSSGSQKQQPHLLQKSQPPSNSSSTAPAPELPPRQSPKPLEHQAPPIASSTSAGTNLSSTQQPKGHSPRTLHNVAVASPVYSLTGANSAGKLHNQHPQSSPQQPSQQQSKKVASTGVYDTPSNAQASNQNQNSSKPPYPSTSVKQVPSSSNGVPMQSQSIDYQVEYQSMRSHPLGMTSEQAEAWDLERATIIAEGEQWRKLFSQVSADYEMEHAHLMEAKSVITVLEEELRDKTEKLTHAHRLEQEYTRQTIFLENQLRGSQDRVSHLETEFQNLEVYRKTFAKKAGGANGMIAPP